MKDLSLSPRGRGWFLGIANALLAAVLVVLSVRYVQPEHCYRLCAEPPCEIGACRFGEQTAGWPFPVVVDSPGGGSPVTGWGVLGPEDFPSLGILLDLLFYSALVWLAIYGIGILRGQAPPLRLIAFTLPLNLVLAVSLGLVSMMQEPWGLRLAGRVRQVPVELHTPGVLHHVMGMVPTPAMPVGDLIRNLGEPEVVYLEPGGTSEVPTIRITLYWKPDRYSTLSVRLPPVRGGVYLVEHTTPVEMVLVLSEEQYLGLAEIPTVEVIPWMGYGSYPP